MESGGLWKLVEAKPKNLKHISKRGKIHLNRVSQSLAELGGSVL